jgi:catechol 2,3-dioxygenase-like lactoylglutathione lyase family enzyme
MPEFSGIDHSSLSVTDLDRSERFYTEILDLLRLADFGYVRILIHRPTSFLLALVRHDASDHAPFSELNTDLDHLAFGVASRDELVEWERKLQDHGVEYTPIRDMEFGAHLNFRDPDNIALELSTSNDVLTGWLAELKDRGAATRGDRRPPRPIPRVVDLLSLIRSISATFRRGPNQCGHRDSDGRDAAFIASWRHGGGPVALYGSRNVPSACPPQPATAYRRSHDWVRLCAHGAVRSSAPRGLRRRDQLERTLGVLVRESPDEVHPVLADRRVDLPHVGVVQLAQ